MNLDLSDRFKGIDQDISGLKKILLMLWVMHLVISLER